LAVKRRAAGFAAAALVLLALVVAWTLRRGGPWAPAPRDLPPAGAESLHRERDAREPAPVPPKPLAVSSASPPAGDQPSAPATAPEPAGLEGVVVDAEGGPVARARVRIGNASTMNAETDAEGRFRIAVVATGLALEAAVDADGFAPFRRLLEPLETGEVR